jgi:hypothetical protein
MAQNVLSVWQPPAGFMSLIAPLGEALKPFRTFQIGPPKQSVVVEDIMDVVKFVWTGERSILYKTPTIDLAFNV